METANRPAWADALIASALACVLTLAWAWRDWADLSALRLPDADDLMLMGKASTRAGVVAGVATTLSLVVGMEMTPVLVAAAAIAIGQWVIGDRDAGDRLMGFGVGLCAATLAASFVFRSVAWEYPACDAFT